MIVLVCGGRDYNDKARVFHELNQLERQRGLILGLIHGDARGADRFAGEWQAIRIRFDKARRKAHGERQLCPLWSAAYPADWALHGPSAGPIRNTYMLEQNTGITCVLAFPGGRGTADMISKAQAKGLEVVKITE